MNDSSIDYGRLAEQARGLLSVTADPVANAANLAALIFDAVDRLNWAGFYFLREGELIVGPFQGKPACVRIAMGKGVCGTAADKLEIQRVADVHAFDGHIACDPDSRAELVVPLLVHGTLVGVVDIDSPAPGRFSEADQAGVEEACAVLSQVLENHGTESLRAR